MAAQFKGGPGPSGGWRRETSRQYRVVSARVGRGYGMLMGCGRIDPGEVKSGVKSVLNVNLLKISGISAKKANVVLLP